MLQPPGTPGRAEANAASQKGRGELRAQPQRNRKVAQPTASPTQERPPPNWLTLCEFLSSP